MQEIGLDQIFTPELPPLSDQASTQAQAGLLSDNRIPLLQRQVLAGQISDSQGNIHMLNVLGVMQRQGSSRPKPLAQTKLSVNEADDQYAQEANPVADEVTHISTGGTPPLPNDETNNNRTLYRAKLDAEPLATSLKHITTNGADKLANFESLAQEFGSILSVKPKVDTTQTGAATVQGLGTVAAAKDDTIYIDTEQLNPTSNSGRNVIAHEVVHLAQARLPGKSVSEQAVEAEAHTVGKQLAEGTHVNRVYAARDGSRPAEWHPPGTPPPENELRPDGFLIKGKHVQVERLWYEQYYLSHRVESNRLILQRLSELSMPWIAKLPETDLDRAANNIELWVRDFQQRDVQTVPIYNEVYVWVGLPPGTNVIWEFPKLSDSAQDTGSATSSTGAATTPIQRFGQLIVRASDIEAVSGNPRISAPLLTEVLNRLEAQVGASLLPGIREEVMNMGHLGSSQIRVLSSLYTFSRPNMVNIFGEGAWLEFEQRMTASGNFASGDVTASNVIVDPGIPNEEQHFARRMLEEIFGSREGGLSSTVRITSSLISVLHEIDEHPQRSRIIENLRNAGATTESNRDPASFLRHFMQATDMQTEYERLDITPDVTSREREFSWPVEGRIVNHTDLLFTGKDAAFSVEITSRETPPLMVTVPWVHVHWVVRETSQRETSAPTLEDGYTSHMDRLEPPERFTLSFDRPGTYEINAIVDHDLFAPNHFTIFVEVRTEQERFTEVQEKAYSPSLWGEVDEDTRETGHEFRGTSATDIWDTGTVYEGEMMRECRPGMPRVPGHLDALGRRISQVEAYIASGRIDASGRDWATEYLAAMREVQSDIRNELNCGAQLVYIQAAYLSRGEGATSQSLQLVANAKRSEDGWQFTIHDTTQAFDNRNSQFVETAPTYRGAVEQAFTELCKSYPRGLMSARIELLDNATGESTGRYVGFELECNSTWEAVRSIAYHPVVSGIINIAGTAAALFIPGAEPFMIPTLVAYNAVDTIGTMVDLGARDALTIEDDAIGTAQLAMDVIPYVGRATRLIRIGTKTYRVMEGLESAGDIILMTVQAQEQVQSIRMGVVRQAAEVHARIRDLEANNPSDPELPRLREQFGQLQTQANEAWETVGRSMVRDQFIMRASMRVVHRIHQHQLAQIEQSRHTISGAMSNRGREPMQVEDYGHVARVMGVRVEPLTLGGDIGRGDVRITYDVSALGGITNVRVRVGPDASLSMVMHHERTLAAMRRYEGVTGSLHNLLERVRAWKTGGGHIPPGSRAFEARFELQKLPPIIQSLRQELTSHTLTDETRTRIEAQITSIEQQLAIHARAFDDLAEGLGYVAARDNTTEGPVPAEGGDPEATMGRRNSEIPAQIDQRRARSFTHRDEPPLSYGSPIAMTYERLPRNADQTIAPLPEGVVYEFPGGHRVWRVGDTIMHDSTVGESSGQRRGFEHELWSAGEHGRPELEGMHRAHTLGQGTGFESPFGILYAPAEVNLIIQNNGIEEYLRGLQAAVPRGESVHVVTRTTAHPGSQRLKEIRYRVEVDRGGGRRDWLFDYVIAVGKDDSHTVTHGVGDVTHRPELQRYFSPEEVDVPARLRGRFGSVHNG